MNRYFLCFVAFFITTGSVAQSQNGAPSPPLRKAKSARILALGDSITRGSSEGFGNYRRPLQALLAQDGFRYEFVGGSVEQSDNYSGNDAEQNFSPYQKVHEGYGGFRIDQIASDAPKTDDGGVTYPGLSDALKNSAPDIVLLMLGTNDINQNYDNGGPDYAGEAGFAGHAAARMDALVGRIFAARPEVAVVLATVTPLRGAEGQRKATAYNALIRRIVAARRGAGERIVLADMTNVMSVKDLAGDGVHPSTIGYDKMARGWFSALTGELAPPLILSAPLKQD